MFPKAAHHRCSIITILCCVSLLYSQCSAGLNLLMHFKPERDVTETQSIEDKCSCQTRKYNKSFIDMIMPLFCCTKKQTENVNTKSLVRKFTYFLLKFTCVLHYRGQKGGVVGQMPQKETKMCLEFNVVAKLCNVWYSSRYFFLVEVEFILNTLHT